MNQEPLKISSDDLMSEVVEGRLREQATVKSTKEHYEKANVIAPTIDKVSGWRSLLLKSVVYLSLFGAAGGAIGSLAVQAVTERPDRVESATHLLGELKEIDQLEASGKYSGSEASATRRRIREVGQRNPQFVAADRAANGAASSVLVDPDRAAFLAAADREASARSDLLLFGIAGLVIAAALAAADRIIERDSRGTIIEGGAAAVVGAAAGAGVALLLPIIARLAQVEESAAPSLVNLLIAFALFGIGVGVAPGLVVKNARRMCAGIGGGLVGGLLGGLAAALLIRVLNSLSIPYGVACAIVGATIGLSMGWLEEAAKQGWLRVASGLIAGKQFILYRNPTFVGSAPMSHIYLFRDPQVGRRHAAIFLVTGGYEIENLPLGGPTLVNGQPVTRMRLRRGDRISIGRTTMVFDEKVAS